MTNEKAIEYAKLKKALLETFIYQENYASYGNYATYHKELEFVNTILSALSFVPTGEPLTLEQLRKMDGQPVWIVESPDWGHWELSEDAEDYICDRDTDLYGLTYPDPDGKAGLHKLGWVAYAYPPAHIDREAWKPCADCKSCVSCEYSMVPYGEKPCTVCRRKNKFKPRKFCNSCGKPLTEEAWAELEKRLRG